MNEPRPRLALALLLLFAAGLEADETDFHTRRAALERAYARATTPEEKQRIVRQLESLRLAKSESTSAPPQSRPFEPAPPVVRPTLAAYSRVLEAEEILRGLPIGPARRAAASELEEARAAFAAASAEQGLADALARAIADRVPHVAVDRIGPVFAFNASNRITADDFLDALAGRTDRAIGRTCGPTAQLVLYAAVHDVLSDVYGGELADLWIRRNFSLQTGKQTIQTAARQFEGGYRGGHIPWRTASDPDRAGTFLIRSKKSTWEEDYYHNQSAISIGLGRVFTPGVWGDIAFLDVYREIYVHPLEPRSGDRDLDRSMGRWKGAPLGEGLEVDTDLLLESVERLR